MAKLLIATGIFPPDIGGPATMLSHLAQDLTARGFEIKIITYAQEYKNIKIREYKNLDVYRIKKNNKLKYFWQMWQLARGVDLIYTTDTYSVGYFAYLIKKLTGRKYILRFTGDSAWETARTNGWTEDYIIDFNNTVVRHPEPRQQSWAMGSFRIQNKINKLRSRRNKILFNADEIIVDCEFNKKLATLILEQYGSSQETGANNLATKKIVVIPNAVDFEGIPSCPRRGGEAESRAGVVGEAEGIRQKYSPHGEKIILTACRLTPWKGVDTILEVLPELKEKIGAFKFLIMGEGTETGNLKLETEKLDLENDVIFLGKVPHAETYNYLKAADVFILNSQYEGTSHALLDAMSAGVSILASNVGGNPELIENGVNGFLFEYNNKKEILAGLEKILIDCRDRSRPVPTTAEFLSANACEKVKKFKWSGVVEKTEEVIKSLGK